MEIKKTTIKDVIVIVPKKHGDHRGFFSETYNSKNLKDCGININFVQDNHSLSAEKYTLRGLHYQSPPFDQDKLVRVVKGSILDVAVDIRKGSPTYGHYVKEVLSDKKWNQILVPTGFAHGFLTLEKDTEVIYKVSNFYSKDNDHGISWNDKDINIIWNEEEFAPILSEKDNNQPLLKDIESPFKY